MIRHHHGFPDGVLQFLAGHDLAGVFSQTHQQLHHLWFQVLYIFSPHQLTPQWQGQPIADPVIYRFRHHHLSNSPARNPALTGNILLAPPAGEASEPYCARPAGITRQEVMGSWLCTVRHCHC